MPGAAQCCADHAGRANPAVDVVFTGWFLFMVFAAVGFVALPMDLIREWVGRPKSTIPKSEYINRARALAGRAKDIKVHSSLSPPACLSSIVPACHCPVQCCLLGRLGQPRMAHMAQLLLLLPIPSYYSFLLPWGERGGVMKRCTCRL
jgi:hypothetical protein